MWYFYGKEKSLNQHQRSFPCFNPWFQPSKNQNHYEKDQKLPCYPSSTNPLYKHNIEHVSPVQLLSWNIVATIAQGFVSLLQHIQTHPWNLSPFLTWSLFFFVNLWSGLNVSTNQKFCVLDNKINKFPVFMPVIGQKVTLLVSKKCYFQPWHRCWMLLRFDL